MSVLCLISTSTTTPVSSPNMSQLTAVYTSPSSTHTMAAALPSNPDPANLESKTAFLSALRSNLTTLQSQVNDFLTEKMEQDKAVVVAGAREMGNRDEDEKAEELYGEEAEEEG